MEKNKRIKTRIISVALMIFAVVCLIVSLGISGAFERDRFGYKWEFYEDFLDYLIMPQAAEGIAVFFWLFVAVFVASIVFWIVKIDGIYCGMGTHIVLCLFTMGIWYFIWIYRITKYLNETSDLEKKKPKSELLLCIFIPFYQIFWYYKHGQKIDSLLKQKRINNSDMTVIYLILGIVAPILACLLMQDKINAICNTKESSESVNDKETDSIIEQIKKYKELLDLGVITQEEFETKKKQLLKL